MNELLKDALLATAAAVMAASTAVTIGVAIGAA
jgi:hypothetical protein